MRPAFGRDVPVLKVALCIGRILRVMLWTIRPLGKDPFTYNVHI